MNDIIKDCYLFITGSKVDIRDIYICFVDDVILYEPYLHNDCSSCKSCRRLSKTSLLDAKYYFERNA